MLCSKMDMICSLLCKGSVKDSKPVTVVGAFSFLYVIVCYVGNFDGKIILCCYIDQAMIKVMVSL